MENVLEIYQKNQNSKELKAWIALYQVFIESQEDKYDIWFEFVKGVEPKKILGIQRQFLVFCQMDKYEELYRPVLNKEKEIIKLFDSFAISYCKGRKFIAVDFV